MKQPDPPVCRAASRFRLNTRLWQCVCVLVSLQLILIDGLFVGPNEELLVNTKWGFVRGKWSKSERGRSIANFLGIPYALPPLGELRFKSPQRWNRMWTIIRNATSDGKMCIQIDGRNEVVGSEDCLYLNVFVPYISEEKKPKKLPILAYVHGGGYMIGSSNSELYAPDYLLDQDIILVTMNYRLSVLGFFSTGNQVSPGNYGLKDIKVALEWIQENIENFGGDAKSVTLVGCSAGSAATHLLALSKKTEGLFHRYRQVGLKLAKLVGCQPGKRDAIASNETTTGIPTDVKTNDVYNNSDYKVTDDEEILKCMRKVDAKLLERMTPYFSVWRQHPWCNFGPTLEDNTDDAILTMHPLKAIKNGLFRDIPAIFQVTKDEGLVKTISIFTNPDTEDKLIENFEEYLPYFMECNEVISNTSAFASAIQDFYFDGNVTLGLTHNITEMTGDGLIVWPMFQALQYQSKIGKSRIYFSFFAYQGTFTFTYGSGIPIHYGVDHGDDLNYLFPILNNMYHSMMLHNTENDITMINIMTEMWTSFVINGIPKAGFIPAWPDYRDHHEFMRFGIDRLADVAVQTDFLSDRMEFWEMLDLVNESAESTNDVIVGEPPKDILTNSAIDHRLSVEFVSLIMIYFYV